jgi:hypothetical protein
MNHDYLALKPHCEVYYVVSSTPCRVPLTILHVPSLLSFQLPLSGCTTLTAFLNLRCQPNQLLQHPTLYNNNPFLIPPSTTKFQIRLGDMSLPLLLPRLNRPPP